jgi:hypothetical protein
MNETVGEGQELCFLLLPRLEACLDQFHDDPTGTRTLPLREGLDAANDARRQADTLANGRF